MQEIKIEDSWKEILKDEFKQEYFLNIKEKYHQAIKTTKVLPPIESLFYAFSLVKFDSIKVVILGQDPYHNIKNNIPQAHGLSFSVPDNIKIPPSLRNIFKELNRDLGIEIPKSGNLSRWGKEGVLLLNSILSVEYKKPLSHRHFGWEIFTNRVIEILSQKRENLVFMLWGNYAKSKRKLIDTSKHYILEAAHPSPLAREFLGCSHFSKCNEILKQNNIKEIDWNLA